MTALRANAFADCDSIEQVIGEAVGAGSVCWENLDQTGVFQSELASEVVDAAVTRVRALIDSGGNQPV